MGAIVDHVTQEKVYNTPRTENIAEDEFRHPRTQIHACVFTLSTQPYPHTA